MLYPSLEPFHLSRLSCLSPSSSPPRPPTPPLSSPPCPFPHTRRRSRCRSNFCPYDPILPRLNYKFASSQHDVPVSFPRCSRHRACRAYRRFCAWIRRLSPCRRQELHGLVAVHRSVCRHSVPFSAIHQTPVLYARYESPVPSRIVRKIPDDGPGMYLIQRTHLIFLPFIRSP